MRSVCQYPDCGGKFGPVVIFADEAHEYCSEHEPEPVIYARIRRLLAQRRTAWLVIQRPHGTPERWWWRFDPRIVIQPSTYSILMSDARGHR